LQKYKSIPGITILIVIIRKTILKVLDSNEFVLSKREARYIDDERIRSTIFIMYNSMNLSFKVERL
jgi:hypothetical protein